ncbi:cadherin-like beta sandwich domain-containing protein [Pseudopedobacter beijingensis]|uniref:Cadherin-like beta sandwich domain-containing protein n=1 Tax=Pseudopedobacter beijingensis TaxID=1207056 RepID=A0ABW4IAH6_9SPHI
MMLSLPLIFCKSYKYAFLFVCFSFFSLFTSAQNIRYVKAGAVGNGTAWNNALGNIQSAIDLASANDVIYVAAGEYQLFTGLNINKAVKVYGGFAGTENSFNDRNIALLHSVNATKITAAISLRTSLITINSTVNTSIVLDGLNLGNALYGAVTVEQGNPQINRCKFENNSAVVGAALYITKGEASISNSMFHQNKASAESLYGVNYPIPSNWTLQNYYTGATVGADGWINGMNIYLDKEKAMYFDLSARTDKYLYYIYIGFGMAQSNNPNKLVPIKIYDGTSGTPGALLGSQNLTMASIMADVQGASYSGVSFDTPLALPVSKKIFISIDLSNLKWGTSEKDILNVTSNKDGDTNPSLIWEKQSDNLWYRYGTTGSWNLNASLLIHPFLSSIGIKTDLLGAGGAIHNATTGSFKVVNCLFSNNKADRGGAIYNYGLDNPSVGANLVNNTFYNNEASKGGAIFNDGYSGSTYATIYNNIIWGNIADIDKDVADNGNASIAKNNITQGFKAGVDFNQNINPLFTNAASGNFTLQVGSMAINAGNASFLNGITLDLAGTQRIQYNGLDLGAYESSFASANALLTSLSVNQGTLSPIFDSGIFNYEVTVGNAISTIILTPTLKEQNAIITINNITVNNGQASNAINLNVGQNSLEVKVTAQDGVSVKTYILTVKREAALPVELLSFQVKASGQSVKLEWLTQQEKDNLRFDVYRKGDTGEFVFLGSQKGAGNSNLRQHYAFYDSNPLVGNNYYRLVQIDLDGKEKELGVEPFTFDTTIANLEVYPNPTTQWSMVSFKAGEYQMAVLSDLNGKKLIEKRLQKADHFLKLDFNKYSIGYYVLTLVGQQEKVSKIIIKR